MGISATASVSARGPILLMVRYSPPSLPPQRSLPVTAAAEAAADQATLGIFVGDDTEISADLSGAIIPVVSGEPNANQTTRILLTGGDPNETHSVTFSNIAEGMTVTVGGNPATVLFGTLTIEEVPIGIEVLVQFTASQELLGSQFGLTDP